MVIRHPFCLTLLLSAYLTFPRFVIISDFIKIHEIVKIGKTYLDINIFRVSKYLPPTLTFIK